MENQANSREYESAGDRRKAAGKKQAGENLKADVFRNGGHENLKAGECIWNSTRRNI